MKLDVVFVCQQGELEVMASVLAASLRQFCGDQVHLHVIEPIPSEQYGVISSQTRKFLDGLDARWYRLPNPIADDYKIFNKLNAFNIQPQGEKILFLDSDVVVRRPFLQALRSYFSRPFAAASGGKQKFSAEAAAWKPVYGLFDLPVPPMRWPAGASHQWGPPYFNAGVMLVDAALDFSKYWIDTHRRIHQDERLEIKNRGTVQISLPVVLYRRNISYALLDRRFNFGVSKAWVGTQRVWADEEANIIHYFQPGNLCTDPVIESEVIRLVKNFNLRDILLSSPRWHKLLRSVERSNQHAAAVKKPQNHSSLFRLHSAEKRAAVSSQPAAAKPEFALESRMLFVTGIPRSGASLFSSLLAQLPDVAVLDEPDITNDLKHFKTLDQFEASWKKWRKDFEEKRLIPDNVASEKIASSRDSVRDSLQPGRNSNFVLATKHTLGYLPRLNSILATFPQATVFIVVRNPFETIASWMAAPSLRETTVIEQDEFAGIASPFLSEAQRQPLLEVQRLNDPAMKRAGLWEYFAGLVDTHAEGVHVFRYEDMIENPAAVLKFAYEKLFPGLDCELPEITLNYQERKAHGMLTAWDQECIRAICGNKAVAFDYHLYEH
jgi:lipopolysaccharide biosynthesis glycosyltransferase